MSDNVECPFCGIIGDFKNHPYDLLCPLSTFTFTSEQWAMRPPKKEQPSEKPVDLLTLHLKYRKKPIVVEAWQWDGKDIQEFPEFLKQRLDMSVVPIDESIGLRMLLIDTQHGVVACDEGDWIIIGAAGEAYPCKASIFEATYERVWE